MYNCLNLSCVIRFLRLHMLASVGYVVIIIDSRGSSNRGVKFEAHIHSQMVSEVLQLHQLNSA